MTDRSAMESTGPDQVTGATPDNALRNADRADAAADGPVLAADGRPLKSSLARSLRMQKLRALGLIAPLLIFVLVSFIIPIADMLFRSVENDLVGSTLPLTTSVIDGWDDESGELPGEGIYQAAWFDIFAAAEAKKHTKLGTRLNYQLTGISSLFRQSGRKIDDLGKDYEKALRDVDGDWRDATVWVELMAGDPDAPRADVLMDRQRERIEELVEHDLSGNVQFSISQEIADLLPVTAREYAAFANFTVLEEGDALEETRPWESVFTALAVDLQGADVASYEGPRADMLRAAAETGLDPPNFTETFAEIDEDWANLEIWATIKLYSPPITPGYFLNAVDMQLTPDGVDWQPENKQILLTLFGRTIWMSGVITLMCVLLAYPVAYLLANLRARTANLLMILVLLPFWTSLLVRTSAWKVMLQQQGVINDVLVWLGLVNDASRLVMINNQFGTIVAMTHILLPFMILPMYSVMQTIPISYVRAARSLGATQWTAFWRVYFPQSVPGIGAGSILVFILSIGYYITPEIVGGTKGVFISNRIAYHISSSLNWGLAAALGAILLAVVLVLYWAYDKIVGIDNVKLG